MGRAAPCAPAREKLAPRTVSINETTDPAEGPQRSYRGLNLDPFQIQAIEALERGDSVLVCAPTGTGKTVVADWAVEQVLAAGKEVVYTAPIKALSNQKYRDYCRMLGADKVGLVTGDLVIRRDAPCRVMTTEILRNMLLSGEPLTHLGAVIVDEIHFLDDRERGTTWEEVLIYLPQNVQIVGLSATLSNLDDFAAWLQHVRERRVEVVVEERRAVPLSFSVATVEGGLRAPADMDRFHKAWAKKNAPALAIAAEQSSRKKGRFGDGNKVGAPTRHHQIFRMLWPNDAPYLYFTFSRRDAEGMARALAQRNPQGLLSEEERQAVIERLAAFVTEPGAESALDRELGDMYCMGIAFHHAGLHVMLKALVEELYEKRLIKVLYCTSTFALGINMPARTAVFDGLVRFDGRELIRLPAREFMQMAGRAGRRGLDSEGLVVVRTTMDDWPEIVPQLKHYLSGKTEPVFSRFSLSFNSVVNLLDRHPLPRIRSIVEKSFLAFARARQAQIDRRNAERLRKVLTDAGWTQGQPPPAGMDRDFKRMREAEAKVVEGKDRTWQEVQTRFEALKSWGYLAEDGAFNAGAKVLKHIQISEIFTTELFLSGKLDELDMPTLFGVCCGICANLPRGATTHAGKPFRVLGKEIEKIRNSQAVVEAEVITGSPVSWDPEMIAFGHWWANGRSLAELRLNIQYTTDISGDLVGAFRRAKDLIQQLRDVYEHDKDKVAELEKLSRTVTRDEVEVVD